MPWNFRYVYARLARYGIKVERRDQTIDGVRYRYDVWYTDNAISSVSTLREALAEAEMLIAQYWLHPVANCK